MTKQNLLNRAFAAGLIAAAALPFSARAGTTETVDKNPVAAEETGKMWQISADGGYETRYIFRGTNLAPGSDGLAFGEAQMTLSFGNSALTFGAWYGRQLGTARANSWSIGEGGGGNSATFGTVAVTGGGAAALLNLPTTFQNRFQESDFYVQYKLTLGPVDVTIGNIAFIIDRDAYTIDRQVIVTPGVIFTSTGTRTRLLRLPTVGDEAFDRMYIRLSTSQIPHIVPSLTYYQTIINSGGDYFRENVGLGNGFFSERNENLGGYLEAKVAGHFAVVPDRVYLDPYALVSVNFEDRARGVTEANHPFRAETFTGFHHFQTGIEMPIYLTKFLSIVPFGGYAYHIAEPVIGTRRNELWGGGKLRLEF